MASVKSPVKLPPTGEYRQQAKAHAELSSDTDDPESIPYHAREYARPFTYGNLPKGFTLSELNHVPLPHDDSPEATMPKAVQTPTGLPPSPSTLRRTMRPSISPSPPVLRKTPTRQEFEEMLIERREQALREQNNNATKLAQNAAIQKDLDELQEILNKKGLGQQGKQRQPFTGATTDIVRRLDTVELPEERLAISNPRSMRSISFEPEVELAETRRSETPAFPELPKSSLEERCVSPYPIMTPSSPTLQRVETTNKGITGGKQTNNMTKKAITYSTQTSSNETHEVEPHLVKFAKDSSEFWYKPHMTRDEAVALLRNAIPGSFIIRNSTTYKNAYGLVLRVAKLPPGVEASQESGGVELVRHFLLEPTTRGVRLKGCANEPNFTSLSALVYQHSINQLALPCTLTIPDRDLLHSSGDADLIAAQKQLMWQGAACNVLYLYTCDMESLTGDEAIRKAVHELYSQNPMPAPTEVHLKVSQQGITLTDNTRRLFFRRHYTAQNISHFGVDPDNRFWSVPANDEGIQRAVNKTMFAFVARPMTGSKDNQCHVFSDLAATQPASAIVSFANKVLPMDKHNHKML